MSVRLRSLEIWGGEREASEAAKTMGERDFRFGTGSRIKFADTQNVQNILEA